MTLIELLNQESSPHKDKVVELVKTLSEQDHSRQSLRDTVKLLHHVVRRFTEDEINYPSHYTRGNIEVIDYIEDQQFCYHLGNAVDYISRAKHKGHMVNDLRKAIWFISRKIEGEENDHSTRVPKKTTRFDPKGTCDTSRDLPRPALSD
ncbi:MAG: hypothetical protein DDT33_00580 [Firmicutes bacterium]|nr:hypothetical protein [Bacillota bacterium]